MAQRAIPSKDREFLAFHDRNAAEAIALAGKRALMVGGGATGSYVAALLGKAGMDLVVVDGDNLELSNLHRHIAPKRFVGKNKAEAIGLTLAGELPKAQRFWAVKRPLESIEAKTLLSIVSSADIVIAATGNDAADRVLNALARHVGVPFLAPSLWPDTHPGLGDLLVVLWQRSRRNWSFACFQCLRPPRSQGGRGLVAQRGLGIDVVQVANFTAQLAIALLLPDGQRGQWLTAELDAGRNYFVIPRVSPRLRPAETTRRPGCRACDAPAAASRPPRERRTARKVWSFMRTAGRLTHSGLWATAGLALLTQGPFPRATNAWLAALAWFFAIVIAL